MYLIKLNYYAHFGNHVTNYDITFQEYTKNTLPKYHSFLLDVSLKMV